MSKAQRRDILAALARSGEALPQFARRMGLKYSTLARWVQNSRGSQRRGRPPQVQLLEAIVDSTPTAPLVLQLPGGVRVEVANEKQAVLAAALIHAMEKPC